MSYGKAPGVGIGPSSGRRTDLKCSVINEHHQMRKAIVSSLLTGITRFKKDFFFLAQFILRDIFETSYFETSFFLPSLFVGYTFNGIT